MPPDGAVLDLVPARADYAVAIVVQGVPYPSKGASAVLFFQYAKAIADAGYRVMTIVLAPQGAETTRQLSRYEDAMNHVSHVVRQIPIRGAVVRPSRFGLQIDGTAITGVGRV